MDGIDTAAVVEGVVEQLTGKLDAKVDAVTGRIQEQVMAQVEQTLKAAGFGEDDEGHITRPPAMQGDRLSLTQLMSAVDPTKHNPSAIGARVDGKFKGFGDFLRAVAVFGQRAGRDPRLVFVADSGEIKADLSGQELATGGALVPEEFRAQLLQLGLQATSIRPRTFQLPMGSAKVRIPAVRTSSHASHVFGGVRAYWTKSGQTITESEPTFDAIELEALGLKILTDIQNELLSDSFVSAEALLIGMWTEAIPWYEEQSFIRGTGAGQPLGVLNSPALVSVTRNTSTDIKIQDLASMESRLLPGSGGRAVYMAHPSALAKLMLLTNGSVQVWHADLRMPVPMSLNGRPLIINEHMSTLGAAGDLALIDWKYYLLGDRQALSIASSPHEKFSDDITVFRGVERLDGQPWLNTAITPAQGSDTLSPFVTIAA